MFGIIILLGKLSDAISGGLFGISVCTYACDVVGV